MSPLDIIYMVAYFIILYCSVLWFLVFFTNYKNGAEKAAPLKLPSVSIIVPAFNEERNIYNCVQSLLNLDYPRNLLKIYVVNDGSRDGTRKICESYAKKGLIRLINQKNQGKAAAMNNALKHVKTEYVVSMDADSIAEREFLRKMVAHADNKISIITPAPKVMKKDNWIEKIQYVEYMFSIFLRKAFTFFDSQYVAPGPGSMYKTEVLKKLGGFDTNSAVEDMEIAFRFFEKGYKLDNCENAYVYTRTPKSFKDLLKQRLRWYKGYFQTVAQYSHMRFNRKFGNLGLFLLPMNYVWVLLMIFITSSFLFNSVNTLVNSAETVVLVNNDIVPLVTRMELPTVMNLSVYSIFFAIFSVLSIITIIVSVKVSGEKIKIKEDCLSYLLFILLYPVLITVFWTMGLKKHLFGDAVKW